MTTTTPTQTLEDALKQAFDALHCANVKVAGQQRELEKARQRVKDATALQQTAQLGLTNAEARYRVLDSNRALACSDATESLSQEVAEIDAELEIVDNAKRLRDELKKVASDVDKLVTQARSIATTLADPAETTQSPKPNATSAAARRNGADALDKDLATLQTSAEQIKTQVSQLSVPTPEREEVLKAKRDRLACEIAEIDQKHCMPKAPVDPKLLDEADAEVKQAKQAVAEAPNAVRRAQAALTCATDSLEQAAECVQAAQDQITALGPQFVERVVVSAPNAKGIVTAQAAFKVELPAGFTLGWQAGGASIEPPSGNKVSIDTTTLPVGQVTVQAAIQRDPTPPQAKSKED